MLHWKLKYSATIIVAIAIEMHFCQCQRKLWHRGIDFIHKILFLALSVIDLVIFTVVNACVIDIRSQ